jgi:hypothetical protein
MYGPYNNSISMPICMICGAETKFLYHEYDQFKIRPPRCLGCILRFPPKGFVPRYKMRLGPREKFKYHQWAVVQQDEIGENWLCLRCEKFLSSPGLGYPTNVSCMKGTEKTLRNVFWADVGIDIVCPRCRRPAILVEDSIAYKYKIVKRFFPYVCQNGDCE